MTPSLTRNTTSPKSSGSPERWEVMIQVTPNHHVHDLLRGRILLVSPSQSTSPSLRTVIFSAISKTSFSRWEMNMIAIPRALSFMIRSFSNLDFGQSQSGGGLVHDQNFGLEGNGLRNLDQLLLGDRQGVASAVGQISLSASDFLQNSTACLFIFGNIQRAELAGFPGQENILRHCSLGQQVELLVDNADPLFLGPWVSEGHLFPVQDDLARNRECMLPP